MAWAPWTFQELLQVAHGNRAHVTVLEMISVAPLCALVLVDMGHWDQPLEHRNGIPAIGVVSLAILVVRAGLFWFYRNSRTTRQRHLSSLVLGITVAAMLLMYMVICAVVLLDELLVTSVFADAIGLRAMPPVTWLAHCCINFGFLMIAATDGRTDAKSLSSNLASPGRAAAIERLMGCGPWWRRLPVRFALSAWRTTRWETRFRNCVVDTCSTRSASCVGSPGGGGACPLSPRAQEPSGGSPSDSCNRI